MTPTDPAAAEWLNAARLEEAASKFNAVGKLVLVSPDGGIQAAAAYETICHLHPVSSYCAPALEHAANLRYAAAELFLIGDTANPVRSEELLRDLASLSTPTGEKARSRLNSTDYRATVALLTLPKTMESIYKSPSPKKLSEEDRKSIHENLVNITTLSQDSTSVASKKLADFVRCAETSCGERAEKLANGCGAVVTDWLDIKAEICQWGDKDKCTALCLQGKQPGDHKKAGP